MDNSTWTLVVYDLEKNSFSLTGSELSWREAQHVAKQWPRDLDHTIAIACEQGVALDLFQAATIESAQRELDSNSEAESLAKSNEPSSVYLIQKLCGESPVMLPHVYRLDEAIAYCSQATRMGFKISMKRVAIP